MKKLSISVLLLSAIIGTACSDDDNASPVNNPVGISGSYSLTNVSGSIVGVNNNFNAGAIKWTINEGNNTVTIVNNYDDNNGAVEDFLETGTYSFVQAAGTAADQCEFTFKADGMDLGCFSQAEDGTLVFSQQYADGYQLTLQPIE